MHAVIVEVKLQKHVFVCMNIVHVHAHFHELLYCTKQVENTTKPSRLYAFQDGISVQMTEKNPEHIKILRDV